MPPTSRFCPATIWGLLQLFDYEGAQFVANNRPARNRYRCLLTDKMFRKISSLSDNSDTAKCSVRRIELPTAGNICKAESICYITGQVSAACWLGKVDFFISCIILGLRPSPHTRHILQPPRCSTLQLLGACVLASAVTLGWLDVPEAVACQARIRPWQWSGR